MKFSCGCEFDKLNFDNVNLDCAATWDLIGDGLTKGLFQIEGSLGKRYCKSIKPENIEELAAVISLIRPGCLEAEYREFEGKMLSITDTYVKTKRGEIAPEYIDPTLEPIFKSTFGVPVYQEQIMRICTDFAGFSMQEADATRKAVGKKLVDKMAEVEEAFIKSAIEQGHEKELAKTIFSWIDKFSGYGFNKSHAVSYALLGYWGAYAKVHFPLEFFKNKLAFSDSNPDAFDEIKQLVHEAKLFNIEVTPPSIDEMNVQFKYSGENSLMFGLAHIKGVGESALKEVKRLGRVNTEYELFSKLFVDEIKVKKNVIEALIKSGAIPSLREDRVRVLGRYLFLQVLTDRERKYLYDEGVMTTEPSIGFMIKELLSNEVVKLPKRIIKIEKAFEDIKTSLSGNRKKMILAWEKLHLGMPLSGSEVELYSNYKVDTTCRNFLKIRNKSEVTMGVIIESIKRIKDKKGNAMCFMSVSDATYMIDSAVVFSRAYKDCAWIIEEGKPVLITGRKNNTSLFVNKIEHL